MRDRTWRSRHRESSTGPTWRRGLRFEHRSRWSGDQPPRPNPMKTLRFRTPENRASISGRGRRIAPGNRFAKPQHAGEVLHATILRSDDRTSPLAMPRRLATGLEMGPDQPPSRRKTRRGRRRLRSGAFPLAAIAPRMPAEPTVGSGSPADRDQPGMRSPLASVHGVPPDKRPPTSIRRGEERELPPSIATLRFSLSSGDRELASTAAPSRRA
jgi:hypothetical protein